MPTLAERRGDLSARTAPTLDPLTQRPFPGNIIPESRMNPIARRVLDLFPLPTNSATAGNYLAQPVLRETSGQGGARADFNLNLGGLLTLRYQQSRQDLFEPFAEECTDVPGFGTQVENTGHNAMIHHQQTLSASVLHSFRLGFNRAGRAALPQNNTTNVAELWGIPWLANINPRDRGYPFFNIQGFSAVGDATPLPLIRYGKTPQAQKDLPWISGAHSFKTGFQLRNTRANAALDLLARGSLSFSGAVSGSGISDLLIGIPSFAPQARPDNPQTLRTTTYAAYFQDEWRASSRVSLTAVLRYEFNTPATDPYDRMAIFQPATGRVVRVGTEGVSRSGVRPDRNNFAPRAGFAYTLRGNSFSEAATASTTTQACWCWRPRNVNPPFFTLRAFFPTATQLITLNNPFPATGGISPVSPSSLSQDNTTAYMQHWTIEVQPQLGGSTTASVANVGSTGAHLIRSLAT